MRVLHRCAVGVALLAIVLAAMPARGQVLKQVPADPWAVLKINNPQAISVKLAALADKLGLAQMSPAFKDPLGALKQQLSFTQGLDEKGEVAVAIYPPKEDGGEPQAVALIPVTDFKAFLGNMRNVQAEGNLSRFTLQGESEVLYGASRGGYAVISPSKELVQAPAVGLQVQGLAAQQLQSNDFVLFANAKVMGAKALPMLQAQREAMLKQLDSELQGANPQYVPAIKAGATQVLNFAENVLKQGQAATLGVTLNDKGVNTTLVGEFDPAGSIAQALKGCKNGEGSMLVGLPNRKYFGFGGGVIDGAMAVKTFDEAFAPVRAELEKVAGAKPALKLVDEVRGSLAVTNGFAFGYAVPTAPGQAIEQEIAITRGDARKIQAMQRGMLDDASALLKQLLPPGEGSITLEVKPDAKEVEGVKLDQISVQMKLGNGPEAAQAAQMMSMLYGPNGISGVAGPASDDALVTVMGGTDELIAATIKSAKAKEDALAGAANVKAVADQLPKDRAAVAYIAVDNIVAEVLKVMEQNGLKIPLKLAPDLPPIGLSASTEGSAVRFDMHLSTDLISNLAAAGMQLIPMIQGGGAPPAQPAPKPGGL